MYSNFFRICLIAACIISAASFARAQTGDIVRRSTLPGDTSGGSISGRVLLPSGQSVNVPIKIRLGTFSNPGMIGYTDTSGRFSFDNLKPGNYTLEVIADPNLYAAVTESVSINSTGGAGSQRVNLVINLVEKSITISGVELDQKVPDPAKKEFDKATKLIKDSKDQEAVERLKQAIAIFPDYLMARNTLGAEYLKLKRLTEAAEQLEAAIKIDPQLFNSRLLMGIVLVEQKKYPEAAVHLNQALTINGEDAKAHLYLGISSLGAGDLDKAEGEFSKALSTGSQKYLVAHYYLAHVHLRRGQRDQAMTDLKIYIEKSPNDPQAAQARALLEKLKSGS